MDRNNSYSNKKNWKYPKKHDKNNRNYNERKSYQQKENEEALPKVELRQTTCEYCGNLIEDLASAMASKENGNPVHFDCVIEKIKKTEKLSEKEKIIYIGQGKFGIVEFPTPQDYKHFEIHRVIEWENRDAKFDWKDEITNAFSSIK